MQTGEAHSATMTAVIVNPKSLLHMLTPGPPAAEQSVSDVHALPVVPSKPTTPPPSSPFRMIPPSSIR